MDFPAKPWSFAAYPKVFFMIYGSHDGSPPEIHYSDVWWGIATTVSSSSAKAELGGNLVGGAEQFKHIKLWQSVSGDE